VKRLTYVPSPALLAGCEQRSLVIVDVGARGGLQPHWRPLAEHLTWVGFEPDARSLDALPPENRARHCHVLPTALSDAKGTATLRLTRDPGDSSLLRPNRTFLEQFDNPSRFDVVSTLEVPTDTLDAQLSTIGLSRVDVLKLDTQGTELPILRGATDLLSRGVIAVDVEVEFSQLYEGQPLFADVDTYLRRFDLALMDLAPRRWPYTAGRDLALARGPVVWAEAVYFPVLSKHVSDIAAMPAPERAGRAATVCLVTLVYGFPDYALALLDALGDSVETKERAALRQAVIDWDTEAPFPAVPISVELQPNQLRLLRASQQRTGFKPTRQLRELIRDWEKAHKS
jgi:FkbM family methyltransferase